MTSQFVSYQTLILQNYPTNNYFTNMFTGFLTPVLNSFLFKATNYMYFSEGRVESTSERKLVATRYQMKHHQVMSQTGTPVSQPGWLIEWHWMGFP